ncbi:MAG: tol-pal system protein YbgF [Candidatus Cloacimonetes bacterium]|jgi:tol-pal system protein YbgF|nr:tol-pal system protein YbgF [Candidatus Cloacimonadota bacterium]MDD2506476.1 tol-pal system protein YbgF [Candidatus Cloacimonadota bacterium]MDD4560333.1 tol-pal system protein YbgF [Candidatus Cloacimonadota bacterium]
MKQLLLVTLVLILVSGCVSNKALREQQGEIDHLEEALAQNNEELVVLRKEITQSRRSGGQTEGDSVMDMNYVQNQFKQNENDMKAIIAEVREMAIALDGLSELVASSDQEIVNMIRDLEARMNAIVTQGLTPEQAAAFTPNTQMMEQNARDIDALESELASLRQQMEDLSKIGIQTASSNEKPEYEAARDEYYKGNFKEAIKKLDAFAAKYPRSTYVGNAIYWKGESYYAQGDFTSALREFRKVISEQPKSWKVADSQLKIGMCYMNMGDHQTARTELNKLKSNYPDYTEMHIAEKLLKQLQ